MAFGRHSGTIWPQVNAAWAEAAAVHGRHDLAWFELKSLADKACRDGQFREVYHPFTGEPYGGWQEWDDESGVIEWPSGERQTWCATGFVRMVLTVLAGLRFSVRGVSLSPHLPREVERAEVRGLRYRNASLDVVVRRGAARLFLDGEKRGGMVDG